MKIIKPDYEKGLLNIMSSIVHHYGCDSEYATHPIVDGVLSRKYNNVFLILIDGMGSKLIERYLPEDSFLRTHMIFDTTTVYPSTTSAATTSVLSIQPPLVHSWLGWFMYFKEFEQHRVLFLNEEYYTGEQFNPNEIYGILPYETIHEKLDKVNVNNSRIYPAFAPGGCKTFEEMVSRIKDTASRESNSFVYCYWDGFDTLMHRYGVNGSEAKEEIIKINRELEEMCKSLPDDQLVMIIADHGQIDTETINLLKYPDVMECLKIYPAIETRTIAFYVKDDMCTKFVELFNKYFGDKFKLFKSEEFINENYFGTGKRHERLNDFIGNYIACSIDKYNLICGDAYFIGQHAGLTEDEMMIPFIVYPKQ